MAEPIYKEPPKAFDASDPQEVNNARKKASRKKYDEINVLKALMSNKETRRWLHDQITFCDPLGNPFVPNGADSTAFNLGLANYGKKLMADISAAAPEMYILMLKEAREQIDE